MSHRYLPRRPTTPTSDFLRGRFDALASRAAQADEADSPEEWIAVFDDWNHVKAYAWSEGARRRHAFNRDTRDPTAEAAQREFRQELEPVADDGNARLVDSLLESPHAEAIARARGPRLLAVLRASRSRIDPRNKDLRVEAGDVLQEYDELVSGASVVVRGEEMTLPRARSLERNPDADLRREAFLAHRGWFVEHREALAGLFGRLVELRHRMAVNLGHESFVPLGYDAMKRIEYGPEEVAAFRRAVREHASPLHERLALRRAEALGTSALRPWDAGFDRDTALTPGAAGPVDEQLAKAERVFNRLSPRLGAHFRRMRECRLIDLENRPGKRPGAYCTTFLDEDVVAIFCNSVGEADDVRTLTHEMGHAFQGWESQWIQPVDLRGPSLDAAEVHSMGMEYLCQPYLDEFFGPDDLRRFRREAWKRAVDILCYACVVDEFQEWIYEHPSASAEERDLQWCRLHRAYLPGIDWTEAEHLLAARWYAQVHIFHHPFYYIDYALAQSGAMQLARMDARDHEGALGAYLELCRLGGTRGVLELFASAGLRSPFDETLLPDLCAHAAEQLGS